MRWPLAVQPEITGRPDDPCAEMLLPDAIDQYASRERVLRAADPFSKFAPPLAFVGIRRQTQIWRRLFDGR